MEENTQRTPKRVDNSNYKERFQFVLKVNDNIIIQRYFRIGRFNRESLESADLFDTLRSIVRTIKSDLESKSRVYLWATQVCETKLTGFADKDGNIQNMPTYLKVQPREWSDTEFVEPWAVTFKFEFIVDDRVVFSEIWDGSQYPKYVRNSVDITNSWSQYPIVRLMNAGKDDLVVGIIRRICSVCSSSDDEKAGQYTKSERYTVDKAFAEKSGIDKDYYIKYSYSPYNKEYVNSWRSYCAKKYGYRA